MWGMELPLTRVGAPRKVKIALAGALCVLAAALPGLAAAAAPGGSAGATLAFTSGTARVVGSQAVVLVRCLGPRSADCTGTVSLKRSGHERKAPFSVIGGHREALVVAIGSEARGASRVLAVARTGQPGGGFARSSEILRLRR